MIVNHANKFVFISTPKSGTHTMYSHLEEQFGAKPKEGAFHQRNIPQKWIDCGYYVFTTVRNPFARAVSCWWHLLFRERYRTIWREAIGTVGFLEFMKWLVKGNVPGLRGDIVLLPQSKWLENMVFDSILKLESLESDYAALPFVDGPVKIQRRLSSGQAADVSDYGDWKEIMTDDAAKLVLEWAGNDFTRFGYSREWTSA